MLEDDWIGGVVLFGFVFGIGGFVGILVGLVVGVLFDWGVVGCY